MRVRVMCVCICTIVRTCTSERVRVLSTPRSFPNIFSFNTFRRIGAFVGFVVMVVVVEAPVTALCFLAGGSDIAVDRGGSLMWMLVEYGGAI